MSRIIQPLCALTTFQKVSRPFSGILNGQKPPALTPRKTSASTTSSPHTKTTTSASSPNP